MMLNNVKLKLKNEKLWKEYESKNKDAYGKACVDVARKVMQLLDKTTKPLKNGYFPDLQTAHGLICKAHNDIKAGGITGFMATSVASMIYYCHERGEEFFKSYQNKIRTKSINKTKAKRK